MGLAKPLPIVMTALPIAQIGDDSRSVNAAPCVSVILAPREMSVILAPLDLLSVNLTHSRRLQSIRCCRQSLSVRLLRVDELTKSYITMQLSSTP